MSTSRYVWKDGSCTITLDTTVLDRIVKEMPEKTHKAVRTLAFQAEGYMKMFAAVDTSAMRNSIAVSMLRGGDASGAQSAARAASGEAEITPLPKPPNDYSAYIGPQVDYAIYQEFGTYRMASHPFVMPGIDMAARDFEHVWGDLFK